MKERKDDFVPSWNGEPEAWEDFVISTETYLKTREPWKESQLIAQIISRFDKKGKPWRLLVSLSETERAKLVSKDALLSYLKGNLLESAIPELGRHFRAWIKFKRETGESMRVFILRHRKTLNKMENSLNLAQTSTDLKSKLRVMIDKFKLKLLSAEHAEKVRKATKSAPRTPPRNSSKSTPANSPPRRTWGRSKAAGGAGLNLGSVEEGDEEAEDEDHRTGYDDDGNPWQEDDTWSEGNWSQGSKQSWWKESWWQDHRDKREPAEAPIQDKTEELSNLLAEVELALDVSGKPEIMQKLLTLLGERWRETTIPDQLMGYHLLHASQLTATERSTILSTTQAQSRDAAGVTAVRGNLGLENIESALLTAWQDKELVERDQRENRKASKHGRRAGHSYAVRSDSSDPETGDDSALALRGADSDTSSDEGINDINMLETLSDPEDAQAFAHALQTKVDAKNKYRAHKRTYTQARDLVRNIRKNRRGKFSYSLAAGKGSGRGHGKGRVRERAQTAHVVSEALSTFLNRKPHNKDILCYKCGQKGHIAKECSRTVNSASPEEGILGFIGVVSSSSAMARKRSKSGSAGSSSTSSDSKSSKISKCSKRGTTPKRKVRKPSTKRKQQSPSKSSDSEGRLQKARSIAKGNKAPVRATASTEGESARQRVKEEKPDSESEEDRAIIEAEVIALRKKEKKIERLALAKKMAQRNLELD